MLRSIDENHRQGVVAQIEAVLTKCGDLDVRNSDVASLELRQAVRSFIYAHRMVRRCRELQPGSTDFVVARYDMLRHFHDAIDLLNMERPSANRWHDQRRAAILRRAPAVAKLLRDDVRTPLAMIAIVVLHVGVALGLQHVGGGPGAGFLAAFGAAALVGGFCAFGFQALDHELMHSITTPWTYCALGLAGSACTLVPWFSYYFSGGHERHHRNAGTPQDIDREAFFWAWERTPSALDHPVGSVVWASVVGLGLPVMYVASLSVCLLGNWRRNVKELCYFGADTLATLVVHVCLTRWGGGRALAYLILSMAFGNGFLCHPLIGFWLMQHLCHTTARGPDKIAMQPTVSYDGNPVWNLLNFNALSHVEHHDFSRCPWTKLPELRRLAPEFYLGMYHVTSIRALVWMWVMQRGDKINFACMLAEPPPPEDDGGEVLPKDAADALASASKPKAA